MRNLSLTHPLEVDHSLFNGLLARHVQNGLVDYDGFRDDAEFIRYLAYLDGVSIAGLSAKARMALWINAYNAYTIHLINTHHERRSIRNINRSFFGLLPLLGPWSEPLARVGGALYTLDDIEQRILRPDFEDPRIHFALVCAAIGCAPLRNEAYDEERIDQQLNEQTKEFLCRQPDKNRIDLKRQTVYVSKLFMFRDYLRDFGGSKAAIGRFIAPYYPPGRERDLLGSGRFRLKTTPYDWSLNIQRRPS
jgi:hypothetical protein